MNFSTTDYPLLTVVVAALASMGFVIVIGTWGDALIKEPSVRYVSCSVTLRNMALQHNVTLTDECEVWE